MACSRDVCSRPVPGRSSPGTWKRSLVLDRSSAWRQSAIPDDAAPAGTVSPASAVPDSAAASCGCVRPARRCGRRFGRDGRDAGGRGRGARLRRSRARSPGRLHPASGHPPRRRRLRRLPHRGCAGSHYSDRRPMVVRRHVRRQVHRCARCDDEVRGRCARRSPERTRLRRARLQALPARPPGRARPGASPAAGRDGARRLRSRLRQLQRPTRLRGASSRPERSLPRPPRSGRSPRSRRSRSALRSGPRSARSGRSARSRPVGGTLRRPFAAIRTFATLAAAGFTSPRSPRRDASRHVRLRHGPSPRPSPRPFAAATIAASTAAPRPACRAFAGPGAYRARHSSRRPGQAGAGDRAYRAASVDSLAAPRRNRLRIMPNRPGCGAGADMRRRHALAADVLGSRAPAARAAAPAPAPAAPAGCP